MIKKTLCIALASFALIALPACTTLPDIASAPPAPLEQTKVDEKALSAAWASLATTAVAVDKLIDVGWIKKGTPTGDTAKRLLLDIEKALDAATAAKNALSASNYADAMKDAKAGFDQLASLLKGT